MFIKINLQLCLFVIFNYIHAGGTVNYNPYASNQAHLLHATNSDNDDYKNSAKPANDDYTVYKQSQQNLQGNSNYPQLYRYYYPAPYQQQQQQQLQPPQPTQLWSGPPIVVEDDIKQQQSSSTANIPPTLYQQRSTSSMLLPSLHRNSKAVPPPVYNPQATRTSQFNYDNNNNNNIVYHRDFRHQIDAIPVSQHTTQQDIVSWNNQQQQHQLLEPQQQQRQQSHQQQPQQFYATNTNLRYNGISNDLTSLRNDNILDYGEHFKRYLQNNPRRIRPIY